MLNYKKAGFTLAEVLVALAIVGIVSAMTIPNLLNKTAKKTQATAMRKASVEINEAFDMYLSEKDTKIVDTIFSTTTKINDNFLTHYFKVNKNCGSSLDGCFNPTFKHISDTTTSNNLSSYITLTNSSCIMTTANIAICVSTFDKDTGYGTILVDTNGPKEPNIKGRDIFRLKYTNNNDGEISDFDSTVDCASGAAPDGCFKKLENENWVMTY